MNSSAQSFASLATRAFEECSNESELKYVARTLGDIFVSRRERIAELLRQYMTERNA